MKKLALLGVLLLCLVLVSCPSGNYLLAGLDVKISKFEVCVGEQIELDGIISNYAEFDKTGYIFYIEDYPKNYEVLEGKIYEPLTTGKYLCVEPVLNKNKEFFDLFVDFKGYVDFFYLNDCVSADYKKVNIWLDNNDFTVSPLPESVEDYLMLIDKQLSFLYQGKMTNIFYKIMYSCAILFDSLILSDYIISTIYNKVFA